MNAKILKTAEVFFKDKRAGFLYQTENGYTFAYDEDFLKGNIPISLSLSLRKEPYESKELFSFFRGLLPEGWYLDIVSAKLKIERMDHFGILVGTAGVDTIGAVTVREAA